MSTQNGSFKNKAFLLTMLLIIVMATSLSSSAAVTDTLRVFVIGNSFSGNATTYLPQLAKEGDHVIKFGRAENGGYSLEQHWAGVAAAEANPEDPNGRIYKGKSLKELLSAEKWDYVTIQQYSKLSSNDASYQPFLKDMIALIRKIQPDIKIVMHETWAYRRDAKDWGLVAADQKAKNDEEMHAKLKASYLNFSKEIGAGLMPVGEAFWIIRNDPEFGYKTVADSLVKSAVYPAIPPQDYSLNMGYYWLPDKTLKFDPNHASPAGCYLGSLVWYKYLFGADPQKVKFKPDAVSDVFAARLKIAASQAYNVAGFGMKKHKICVVK